VNWRLALKPLLGMAALALLGAAIVFSDLRDYLLTADGRHIAQVFIRQWLQSLGFWRHFIFILLWSIGCLFLLPASIFTGLGAVLYGKYLSIPMNLTGAFLGGALAFIGSRYFFRPVAESLVGVRIQTWNEKLSRNGMWAVIWMRVCALPYPLVNLIAALSKVTFKDFMWGTVLSSIPSMAYISYTLGSVSEMALEDRSWAEFIREDFWIIAIGLLVFLSMPKLFKWGIRWLGKDVATGSTGSP
jgi:uncharacterized membrane protein YdjX (TVP38/TMEM64 family)